MTLTTSIVLADPTPVEPLFRFCQSLVGDPDSMEWEHTPNDGFGDGAYRNRPGQGLPMLMWLYYGLDGPRRVETYDGQDPPHVIAVHVDNPYGDPDGPNKHAWFVRELGRHLDDLGVRWWWQQEFTGTWYEGATSIAELGDPDGWQR